MEKPLNEMKSDKRYPDGKSFTCKECSNKYNKLLKNGEVRYKRYNKEERKSWLEGHKKCRSCLNILPIEVFGNNKNSYDGKNDRCKECRKPISKARYDKWIRDNAEMRMLISARNRAKNESIPFTININDIVIPEYCPVLGIKLDRDGGKCNDSTPSLDRFIPQLGYIKENVHVISWRANWIKQNSSLIEIEKLYLWMKYISE
jgi:hypothetical protein